MKDFNNLPQWLKAKLTEKKTTVEHFAWKAKLSRGSIYYYLAGKVKPETQAMVRICRALGVPLEEGLKQYSPPTIGRPKGSGGNTRAVTTRSR